MKLKKIALIVAIALPSVAILSCNSVARESGSVELIVAGTQSINQIDLIDDLRAVHDKQNRSGLACDRVARQDRHARQRNRGNQCDLFHPHTTPPTLPDHSLQNRFSIELHPFYDALTIRGVMKINSSSCSEL